MENFTDKELELELIRRSVAEGKTLVLNGSRQSSYCYVNMSELGCAVVLTQGITEYRVRGSDMERLALMIELAISNRDKLTGA